MKQRIPALLLIGSLLLVQAVAPAGVSAAPPPSGSVTTSSGRVLPPLPDGLLEPSIQATMLADHQADAMDFQPGGAPSVQLSDDGTPMLSGGSVSGSAVPGAAGITSQAYTAALPNGLRKEVFGFLPYWMLTDTALASMNYSLVSTVAYFSVGADKNGNLVKGTTAIPSTGWAGWNSSRMTQVIDHAHASGVRVVLTVTMMAWDSATAANQATLLSTGSARATLVSQIVDAVVTRGADGVNLDFEPVATSQRANYVTLVRQLKSALTTAGAGNYVTVDVMASAATWASGYDVAGLTASGAADALFVMGYDYNWSGSSRAGGVAPILSPYTIDVDGTMRDFLAETSGAKIIWGVPYYGRTWPTSSSQLNASTLGGGSKAYYYTGHLAQAAQYGRLWDDVGKVPWYRYQDGTGTWVQGYYDDPQSLGIKYDLINARGLAGTGMWTLLMDQGRDDLWRLLADKFVTDVAPPVGGITVLPTSVDEEAIHVGWRALDYASGVDRYNVQARRAGSSSWTTWLTGTTATSAWYPGTAGKTYEFRVQAVDWKGNAQPWTTVPAKPAAIQPGTFATVTTPGLNVRSGPGTGFGVVTQVTTNDLVYLIDGPSTAGGYNWYKVQYGFTEWPSADYARIGWVAAASGATPYLVPRQSPTVVKADPFVSGLSFAPEFFPNGDGDQDSLPLHFTLKGPVPSAVVEIRDASGKVVRTQNLGPRPAGANAASWDGRVTGSAWAPAGRYLVRVIVTAQDGGTHAAPAAVSDPSQLDAFGVVARKTPFDDIAGSPFRKDIEWLYAAGLTKGCSTTSYCPSGTVTRAQVASFLVRALHLPTTTNDYFDDDTGSIHEMDINRLAAAGIASGCASHRFCPSDPVNRAQMASFLARALHLSAGAGLNLFDDDNGSIHETNIDRIGYAGITSGCGPRIYCPAGWTTRDQLAALLRRAFD